MKKQILSVLATLALLVPMTVMGFAGLNATVTANVPFDFNVGNIEFKAGRYSVGRLAGARTGETLIIRSEDGKEVVNFNVNTVYGKGEPQAKFVFRRYGNQYFLAQVFDGENVEGAALIKSKAERKAAEKRDVITQNAAEPEVVTIVAQVKR